MRRAAILAFALTFAPLASGQNFNVDIDTLSPEVGGGVPSNSFGGALNQPGRWNSLFGNLPWLYDVNGAQRQVSITTQSSSGNHNVGGFNNPINTGDYAKLLNDSTAVNDIWQEWKFIGLINGTYKIATYAVRRSGVFSRAYVIVSNSLVPNPQLVQGTMPGNQLILGVTHSYHEAIVSDGSLTIHVEREPFSEYAEVNGFQIAQTVPEPSTIVFTLFGTLAFLRRRNGL